MRKRTLSALPCLIGVVRDSWHRGCVSVYPLRHSWADLPSNTSLMLVCPEEKHLIHLSLNWAKALEQGIAATSAEIAAQCSIASATVRQIVRLSRLNPDIIAFLSNLRGKSAVKRFPERRLRDIIGLPEKDQIQRFEEGFGVHITA